MKTHKSKKLPRPEDLHWKTEANLWKTAYTEEQAARRLFQEEVRALLQTVVVFSQLLRSSKGEGVICKDCLKPNVCQKLGPSRSLPN